VEVKKFQFIFLVHVLWIVKRALLEEYRMAYSHSFIIKTADVKVLYLTALYQFCRFLEMIHDHALSWLNTVTKPTHAYTRLGVSYIIQQRYYASYMFILREVHYKGYSPW